GPRLARRDPGGPAPEIRIPVHRARGQRLARHGRRHHPPPGGPPADPGVAQGSRRRPLAITGVEPAMTVTIDDTSDQVTQDGRRGALAGRRAGAVLESLDLQAVYLGERLGLYRALEEGGPATPLQLARGGGISTGDAREW